MSATPEIRIMTDAEELAQEAAELFVWLGEQAIKSHGRFLVALSGGSTPQALYTMLAGPEFSARLEWSRVRFFFGDERCVPPDHPESNYGMANAILFQPLKIQADQVFRMKGEDSDPDRAARHYEALLRQECGTAEAAWPTFDVLLLGLGEDGHIASLFPGTDALNEQTRWVVAAKSPRGVVSRLTLTLGVINHAGAVIFLVTGKHKAGVVRAVLEGRDPQTARLPAALVRPQQGRLIWFLDQAAASELTIARQGITSREE
jgi:6-phosphogluconolactonase